MTIPDDMPMDWLRVMRSMFSIPRGKRHFLLLRNEEANIAATMVSFGWTERGTITKDGEPFRLLPAGRAAFLNAVESRIDPSLPPKPQVAALFGDKARKGK